MTTIAQTGLSTVVVVSGGKTSTITFNGGTATRSGSTSAQTGRVFSGSTRCVMLNPVDKIDADYCF